MMSLVMVLALLPSQTQAPAPPVLSKLDGARGTVTFVEDVTRASLNLPAPDGKPRGEATTVSTTHTRTVGLRPQAGGVGVRYEIPGGIDYRVGRKKVPASDLRPGADVILLLDLNGKVCAVEIMRVHALPARPRGDAPARP